MLHEPKRKKGRERVEVGEHGTSWTARNASVAVVDSEQRAVIWNSIIQYYCSVMFLLTSHDGHVSNCLHIMLWPLLALLYVPSCLAAPKSPHDQLVELAAAGNGIIRLNERTFDLLTFPNRDWSASIQLTALNPQRRCAPCKWVSSRPCPVLELNHSQGI